MDVQCQDHSLAPEVVEASAGIGCVAVTTIDSEDGGSFVATYSIPQTLRGLKQIAIRLQSPTGYYSYNWFYNNSTE
ncbi:MAG: hypothetical protein ABUK20_09755 [Anaerolineales bacterium]